MFSYETSQADNTTTQNITLLTAPGRSRLTRKSVTQTLWRGPSFCGTSLTLPLLGSKVFKCWTEPQRSPQAKTVLASSGDTHTSYRSRKSLVLELSSLTVRAAVIDLSSWVSDCHSPGCPCLEGSSHHLIGLCEAPQEPVRT